MSIVLVTPPAEEPFSVEDAKAHLRLEADFTDDDTLITALIQAAREHVEAVTNRALVTQTWRLSLDGFPCGDTIDLPKPSLLNVTAFTYVDGAGATQTYTAYTADIGAFPGRIVRDYGTAWPSTRCQRNAITIDFTAGYGAATDVPAAITAAMKLLIGHWYEQREAVNVGNIVTSIPLTVDALLAPYRFLQAA